jgi:BirA family biotin operon repressor/biotin-[acetyl-CoA-carboxylase] ligase
LFWKAEIEGDGLFRAENGGPLTTRDRILSFFRARPGEYVSGQDMSAQLAISRAAVWKQVRALSDLGFIIESKHSQGYRLLASPELLLAADLRQGLQTQVVACELEALTEVDSTNSYARKLAEKGTPEGSVVIADRQLAGRGRMGRQWESPPAVNLYASVVLRPNIPVQQALHLTFLSAVAVAETLRDVCGLDAQVKWPNDVLVGGAKIAGLLNEMSAETEQIHFVILGIGINLNMRPEQFPEQLNYPVTSALIATGSPVDRCLFTRTLLEKLDSYYLEFCEEGFVPIRLRWEKLCNMHERRVEVDQGNDLVRGAVVGLGDDGALHIRRDSGGLVRILAGDVRLLS